MKLSRRDFLKGLAAAASTLFVPLVQEQEEDDLSIFEMDDLWQDDAYCIPLDGPEIEVKPATEGERIFRWGDTVTVDANVHDLPDPTYHLYVMRQEASRVTFSVDDRIVCIFPRIEGVGTAIKWEQDL